MVEIICSMLGGESLPDHAAVAEQDPPDTFNKWDMSQLRSVSRSSTMVNDIIENEHGRRLIVQVIDERAQAGHHRPFARLPRTQDPKDGFFDVTYEELAAGVNACAWFLEESLTIDKAVKSKPFAWLGPVSDLRYIILVLASMKTGYKVFLPSPRNSITAHINLLDQIDCNTILIPQILPPPVVGKITKQRLMKIIAVPELPDLLYSAGKPYPFVKKFEEVRLDVCCILHTSGSTGIPKAVEIKHQYFTLSDAMNALQHQGLNKMAYGSYQNCKTFVPFPLFHCAGLINNLATVVFFDWTAIMPPNVPISAELVDQVHMHETPRLSFLPAAIIKDLVTEPSFYDNLKLVECVAWGGSPLATEVGNKLGAKTHPMNTLGLTEAGILPWELLEREDWQYLRFSPCLGAHYRQVSEDQYEMVMVRDPKFELHQGIFTTYPELQEWPTKDLFSKHPTKPNLWLYRGRLDDIIIFSNAEKLNPLSIERSITSDSRVSAALVLGQGKFQASLLIEPTKALHNEQERSELLDQLWPVIDKINEETVAHGRISRDMIMFTAPDKPFLRAGKGSVQRAMSVELYDNEIESLYEDHEGAFTASKTKSVQGIKFDLNDPLSLRAGPRKMLTPLVGVDAFDDDTDFFRLGLDSLQASNLARNINSSVGRSIVSTRVIYKNPNVAKLMDAMISGEVKSKTGSRTEHMQAMFDKFSADLPINGRPSLPSERVVVVLTGSTGSLGSYLLHSLLSNPKVHEIHCLNRSGNALQRQRESFTSRGLSDINLNSVMFHEADLALPYFDMSKSRYEKLLERTTNIIHNAWPVNFNMALESFEPQVQGVRRIIDFCSQSRCGASIYFTSSISTVGRFPSSAASRIVPEAFMTGWQTSEMMGYGESKLIAEQLLAKAAEVSKIPVTVCRVGQVAGPIRSAKGQWNRQEWFPSIITSSKHLGKIPGDLGPLETLDWIPVDELSDILVDLMFASTARSDHETSHAQIHHAVNPSVVSWKKLVSIVVSSFAGEQRPQVIPFEEWVDALKMSSHDSRDTSVSKDYSDNTTAENGNLVINPALKLLAFIESLPNSSKATMLDTTRTSQMSTRLGMLGPVQSEWMKLWLEQWNRSQTG